jgi:gas vesicle protein
MNSNNAMKYFGVGLGLGVALGFLSAPKSGGATRAFLRSKALDGKSYVADQAKSFATTATGAVEQGAKTVRQHKDNLGAAVDAGREAYREASSPTTNVRS